MTTQNRIHRVIAAVYVDIACFLAPFDSVTVIIFPSDEIYSSLPHKLVFNLPYQYPVMPNSSYQSPVMLTLTILLSSTVVAI